MKEIAKIHSAIQKRHVIHAVTQNWEADSLEIVRLSLLLMERGLDRITGNKGKGWIRNNLGGTRISLGYDTTLFGNAFVMKKVFRGRAHVIVNRVYLPDQLLLFRMAKTTRESRPLDHPRAGSCLG